MLALRAKIVINLAEQLPVGMQSLGRSIHILEVMSDKARRILLKRCPQRS
jgi:hypothetical protein